MPSLDFETEKSTFREYYNDNHQLLRDAEDFFRSLLTALVSHVDGLEKPSVTSRLKDREECIRKFSRKYQTALEQSQTPYEISQHISDLIGLRIVCLYESDVKTIVRTLRDNFTVHGESNKIEKIESTENTFGYKGFHLDLQVSEARKPFPEYAQFKEFRFEVQVRTTIQDAWSALDHKIKYKKSIPPDLKRRINTLAALFELADHEFLSIRDKTVELLTKAAEEGKSEVIKTPAAVASKEVTPISDSPLDVFFFMVVVQLEFPGYDFHTYAADGFVQELLKLDPALTFLKLAASIEDNLPLVKQYKAQCGHSLNPYTQIRHCLYLADKTTFRVALFDKQRAEFDQWREKIAAK